MKSGLRDKRFDGRAAAHKVGTCVHDDHDGAAGAKSQGQVQRANAEKSRIHVCSLVLRCDTIAVIPYAPDSARRVNDFTILSACIAMMKG